MDCKRIRDNGEDSMSEYGKLAAVKVKAVSSAAVMVLSAPVGGSFTALTLIVIV